MSDNAIKEVSWWEKHVEYTFILRAFRDCALNLVSPLAGPTESISDAVVGKDSKYFIIEFKKTLDHFKDEYKKFLLGKQGLDNAAKAFLNDPRAKFHFIIGGELNNGKLLTLRCARYFEVETSLELSSGLFETGMTKDELVKYAEDFTAFKIDDEGGSNGTGYFQRHVLAVGDGNTCSVIPLSFYYKPELKKKLKLK
ncbi:hypothetical protein JT31_02500 [Cedecea neteri]|uniref:Uncharacterized protein n=1 Tax=Cedecea neteri TaxID=158822 RepID=A0A089RAC8_9ENTR|nr:hypothetical protein [Cedecea neteri]AIR03525.1 hypothetical protein JT31_02500 [Cedecea neteri]